MINFLQCPCLVQPVIILIHKGIDVVKIVVPIGLIILGGIDFGKAVVGKDESEMKKSQGLFIKRLISAVAVFLVFMIVDFVITLLASRGIDTGNGWLDCWNAEPGAACKEILEGEESSNRDGFS